MIPDIVLCFRLIYWLLLFFFRNISRTELIGQELNLKTTKIALVFLKRYWACQWSATVMYFVFVLYGVTGKICFVVVLPLVGCIEIFVVLHKSRLFGPNLDFSHIIYMLMMVIAWLFNWSNSWHIIQDFIGQKVLN